MDEADRYLHTACHGQRQGTEALGRRGPVPLRHAHGQKVVATGVPLRGQAETYFSWAVSVREPAGGAGKTGRRQKAAAGAY